MSDSAPPKNTAPNDTRPEPVECPHCGNVTLPNLLDDSSYVCSCSAERALPMDARGGEMPPPVDDASLVPVRVGNTVDEAERLLIMRTLESTGQNKTRAAEILGVSLKTLHNKLKEYGSSKEPGAA